MTLTPEEPFDIDEVCVSLTRRHDRGKYASIVVVAEGALPKAGTLEVPSLRSTSSATSASVASSILSLPRSSHGRATRLGSPCSGTFSVVAPHPFDRALSSWYGIEAVNAIAERDFTMVAFQGGTMVWVPLADATAELKYTSPELRRRSGVLRLSSPRSVAPPPRKRSLAWLAHVVVGGTHRRCSSRSRR